MKKRILTGWTLIRILYVALGAIIITYSILNHEWFGILFGVYFASMGLFGYGCASGNCFAGTCSTEVNTDTKAEIKTTEIKELN